MGRIITPDKIKLIVGVLSAETALFKEIRKHLERATRNRIDLESDVIDFDQTQYYEKEMGKDLKRKFYSFDRLTGPEKLCDIKIRTNSLEKRFSINGARRLNIDPGYLSLSKVVLLSTKDYTHRVFIGKGIYAEVTLFFQNKTYNAWPWTYPDYRTQTYIDFFNKVRSTIKQ